MTKFEKTAGQIKPNLFIYLDYKVRQTHYADIFEIFILFYVMALSNFNFFPKSRKTQKFLLKGPVIS